MFPVALVNLLVTGFAGGAGYRLTWTSILFLIFACIAVVSAINLVVQTHPIASALSLVGVMGSLAVLYLLLGAEFIAAAQMIVYAGAIMVLFVFVIMLLNAGAETQRGKSRMVKWLGHSAVCRRSSVCSASSSRAACRRSTGVTFGGVHQAARRSTSAGRCSRRICCRSKSLRF